MNYPEQNINWLNIMLNFSLNSYKNLDPSRILCYKNLPQKRKMRITRCSHTCLTTSDFKLLGRKINHILLKLVTGLFFYSNGPTLFYLP